MHEARSSSRNSPSSSSNRPKHNPNPHTKSQQDHSRWLFLCLCNSETVANGTSSPDQTSSQWLLPESKPLSSAAPPSVFHHRSKRFRRLPSSSPSSSPSFSPSSSPSTCSPLSFPPFHLAQDTAIELLLFSPYDTPKGLSATASLLSKHQSSRPMACNNCETRSLAAI